MVIFPEDQPEDNDSKDYRHQNKILFVESNFILLQQTIFQKQFCNEWISAWSNWRNKYIFNNMILIIIVSTKSVFDIHNTLHTLHTVASQRFHLQQYYQHIMTYPSITKLSKFLRHREHFNTLLVLRMCSYTGLFVNHKTKSAAQITYTNYRGTQ